MTDRGGGKVVFVRWFTSPDCPFCSGSAPALRELHSRYAKDGLVVVGMYHHKEPTPLDPDMGVARAKSETARGSVLGATLEWATTSTSSAPMAAFFSSYPTNSL